MELPESPTLAKADSEGLVRIPSNLEDTKIRSIPSTAYYIANFISKDEEQILMKKITAAPRPRWKQLSRRRLQTWPSDLSAKDILLKASLPDWLTTPVMTRILSIPRASDKLESHIFDQSPHKAPNHVLVNEYLPGQGIMPHKDGSAYYPIVCTVSLGSSICLDIYGNREDGICDEKPRWKILQEARSLLITTDQLYADYLHGIAPVEKESGLDQDTIANWDLLTNYDQIETDFDRHTRISLTYRDVIKVSNLGAKIGFAINK